MAPSLEKIAWDENLPSEGTMKGAVLRLRSTRKIGGGQEVVIARVKQDVGTHKAIIRKGQEDAGVILTIENNADAYEDLEGPLQRVDVESIGE